MKVENYNHSLDTKRLKILHFQIKWFSSKANIGHNYPIFTIKKNPDNLRENFANRAQMVGEASIACFKDFKV